MRFELPSNQTLEFSGSRTVPVKSCAAEKRSFTVVLAVAADGTKVPPKVIFKGVRTPRDLVVPHPLCVSFHKKGWMDEQGVKEWIRQSLPRGERSLLVWDSIRAHLNDDIYFMHKLHYSVVKKKNTDQNAKVMETITIKDGSKKYNATLMFIGKLIVA